MISFMLRTILAVLLGWGMVGGLVVCTDMVLMRMFPNDYVEGRIPPDSLALLSLGTGALWSVIGGWFCALIAKTRIWPILPWPIRVIVSWTSLRWRPCATSD